MHSDYLVSDKLLHPYSDYLVSDKLLHPYSHCIWDVVVNFNIEKISLHYLNYVKLK